MQRDEVHQGKLCLLVVQSMVNKRMNRAITVEEAIGMLEHVGWVHNLDTYQQKKKHIYEVLRRSRRDGLTSLRLSGNDIYMDEQGDDNFDERWTSSKVNGYQSASDRLGEQARKALANPEAQASIRKAKIYLQE